MSEKNIVLQKKDDAGNPTDLYPVTKAENVEGLQELIEENAVENTSNEIKAHLSNDDVHMSAEEKEELQEAAAACKEFDDKIETAKTILNEAIESNKVEPGSDAPKAAGTAAAGTSDKFARSDHVHPEQTTVTGNAGTAAKLQTPRTIGLSGAVTGTATNFDGSGNITIPTTGLNMDSANTGTLPVARGGTGATTAAAALTNLGAAAASHTHPDQTTVTGNAGSATKLQTARSIALSGAVTGTATNFDGSGNITIPTTALNVGNATAGTLPVARGGTGGADASTARTNLGVPPTSHASTAETYGVGSTSAYGHVKLTNDINSTASGTAATPAMAKQAKADAITEVQNYANAKFAELL